MAKYGAKRGTRRVTGDDAENPRALIEATVLERARHSSLSRAKDTWSFARAERLLGKEYHGRFLIELLQNAADAWRKANPVESMCDLVVVLDESPALTVANRGAPFPATIVVDSLGQIGNSPKEAGEAIGHKGIGFKSALEISAGPEIYSGFSDGAPLLSVRFDAELARETIRSHSPGWDEWVAGQREFDRSQLEAVPILRYPVWVESAPQLVTDLADSGYDTVVRLGHSTALGPREDWVAKVRGAMRDVSDQILVLLRIFDRIRLEDPAAGPAQQVCMSIDSSELVDGMRVERISIRRNGTPSSNWVRYHRQLEADGDLASEVTVAFRLDAEDPRVPVGAHDDLEASSPFHLFFPTRIGSGLPFLVHGYFQVDAARTGFYSGAEDANQSIVDALADLVIEAIEHLTVTNDDLDLFALAELVATAPPPEAPLAKRFQSRVLDGLDHLAWLPGAPGAPRLVAPVTILPADADVTAALVATFPMDYLRSRSGSEIAHPSLGAAVFQFLDERREGADDLWDALHSILRPGAQAVWPSDAGADARFLALLDLLDAAKRADAFRGSKLIDELLGDDEARLIPVTRPDGQRALVPVPDPKGSRAGARRVSVMARLGEPSKRPLTPPRSLDVEFLPDGLLDDQDRARAEALGVRPFTVDAVMDRLTTAGDQPAPQDNEATLRFLWDLLARERRSDFSTSASGDRALSYANYRWFWLVPGRARADDNQQQRQRRERSLAYVHVPAADGSWRPASELAFGADWAEWIESNLPYADAERRSAAMRRLAALAPDDGCLVAAPDVVLQHLSVSTIEAADDDSVSEGEDEQGERADRMALEQFAFLLRLGCWETLPLEGHQTGRADTDKTWPWPDVRDELARDDDPHDWNFEFWNWQGSGHQRITVSEDARFRWPLVRADHDLRLAMSLAVADGTGLYASLAEAAAFCPGCVTPAGNQHSKWYHTHAGAERPSTLSMQLRRLQWLPTTVAGVPVDGHSADHAWADTRGLDIHTLRTSPLQHLPLVDASDWTPSLRQLCGLETLDEASPERLVALHNQLRTRLEDAPDQFAQSGRQSFVGLHRLIYEALSANSVDEDIIDDLEVLCDLGTALVHRSPKHCRHDDGRHVSHRPRFAGRVPFVVLARDKAAVARALGVPAFDVVVERQGADTGVDMTDQLRHELTDRIPELLAVMVHHAGGTNPLDPTGDAFRERANRLRNLRVRKLDDLVLVVSVVGMSAVREVVGDASRDESYLDNERGAKPVIFHDITGDDWRRRLTRRLASHVAVLSDVAGVYADTFQLLLTAEERDREDLLRSWGVLPEHIQQIRSQLGIFTDTDHARTLNWFEAVLEVLGHTPPTVPGDLDHRGVATALVDAGLDVADADAVAYGIASDRPGDRHGIVIRTLDTHGVALADLSAALERRREPRLSIGVAAERLRDWIDRHGPRLVVALAHNGVDEVGAKADVAALSTVSGLAFVLDPSASQYLDAVVSLLRRNGLNSDADDLALDAPGTIAGILGWDRAELDQRVRELYDDAARAARLADLAKKWAREIRLLALLARASGASADVIRDEARQIDELLGNPQTPSALLSVLGDLLAGDEFATLRSDLEQRLVDDLPGDPPARAAILTLAESRGLSGAAADHLLATLRRDQSKRVAVFTHQNRTLADSGVHVATPAAFGPPPPPPRRPSSGRKFVAPGTVSVEVEWRKKKVGDEAESWAVTAITRTLLDLDYTTRRQAIEAMESMLDAFGFAGSATDRVHGFARAAVEPDLDEETTIDRVAEFVHVSAFADGFGFDVLGWVVDPDEPEGGYPLALEVKAAAGSFFFSAGEWACAERMRATETSRSAYAVLAVRRESGSTAPTAMDLLIDPVQLCEEGKIERDVDTYRMRYTVPK